MNHDLGEVRMKKLSEDQVGAWTPLSPEFPLLHLVGVHLVLLPNHLITVMDLVK